MNKKTFTRFLLTLLALLLLAAQPSCSQQKKEAPAEPSAPKTILPAQGAGKWYSASKDELARAVEGYISAAEKQPAPGRIVALISPHAGYQYSGPTAGHAYRALKGLKFDTVVVVGFSHGYAFNGAAVYTGDAVETPLGIIPVDLAVANALLRKNEKLSDLPDAFHKAEHSLENQFPFLQAALGDFKIVPVMIGAQENDTVDALADALAEVLKGKNALLVASSDMSHFWTYDEAETLDAETAGIVERFDPDALRALMAGDEAGRRLCGHGAVEAVMRAAKKLGADRAVKLHYENSGDVTGDRSRVVGYLAAALVATKEKNTPETAKEEKSVKSEFQSDNILNKKQQEALLKIARESLDAYIGGGERKKFTSDDPALKQKLGMFVTLNEFGRLRGCMGHFDEDTTLADLAASQVIVSATGDPRFPAVRPNELKDIAIEISVLSSPKPVASHEDIEVGRHGVILTKGFRRATFLPQVAPEQGWGRDEMLSHLAMKAGLRADDWKSGSTFEVYTAQVFGEEER